MPNENKGMIPNRIKNLHALVSSKAATFNAYDEVMGMWKWKQLNLRECTRARKLAHIHMQVAIDVVDELFQERKNKWRKENGKT